MIVKHLFPISILQDCATPRARTAPAPTSGTTAGAPLGRRWAPDTGPARPTACGLPAGKSMEKLVDFPWGKSWRKYGEIHDPPEMAVIWEDLPMEL